MECGACGASSRGRYIPRGYPGSAGPSSPGIVGGGAVGTAQQVSVQAVIINQALQASCKHPGICHVTENDSLSAQTSSSTGQSDLDSVGNQEDRYRNLRGLRRFGGGHCSWPSTACQTTCTGQLALLGPSITLSSTIHLCVPPQLRSPHQHRVATSCYCHC